MMRVLGIDPGLQATGWGVIEVCHHEHKYIGCGTIHTDSKSPMARRLQTLHDGLQEIIQRYQPDYAAIEETFVNKNALSSLKLGHARGALMMTLSLAGLEVSEYAATKVKKALVGVGRAEKHQVEAMVSMLLPDATISSADAADALAVALCHAHHRTVTAQTSCVAG